MYCHICKNQATCSITRRLGARSGNGYDYSTVYLCPEHGKSLEDTLTFPGYFGAIESADAMAAGENVDV